MTIEIQRGNVIEMDRGQGKRRMGQGLLKGMVVVWKHFQGSFRKNTGFEQIHGTFTVEYPDERVQLPEAYRNMPILLFDEESGHELCTSCFQCARICPPQVIHMTQAKDPATGKAVPAVAEFIIEYDACMSCGFCAEVCPFDAIKMDHDFELSTAQRGGLTIHKEQLNRPISYYAKIAPGLWDEVKAGALKKLQGNIKRRPDVLGMAPSLTEKIAARRRELPPPAPMAPPAPAPAAPAVPAAPASADEKAAKLAAIRAKNAGGGQAAPAGPAPASADEKAAKLAAIRAKNAAAQGGGAPEPAAAPAAAAPADDKAARLAAIRAKNAAAQGGGAPEPAAAPAAAAPAAAPADDKAARLAAIRAKNAAAQAAGDTGPGAIAAGGDGDGAAAPAPAPAAAAPAPADEKAAKLAAIRAANAAKKAAEQGGGE